MKFTLKQKLLLCFGVNCLLTIISSLFVMVQVQHMRTIEAQVNTNRIPSALAAVRLSRYISDASFAFRNYLLYGSDPALAQKYEAARQAGWKNIFAQYDILKQLAPMEDRELLEQLDSHLRNGSLQIQEDALADMAGHGEEGKAKALERMKGGAALAAKVQADTVEMTARAESRLAQDNAKLSASHTTTFFMALATGLLTAMCAAIVGVLLSRYILGAIEKMSVRMREVAEGDLSGEPLAHDGDDEIGDTINDINRMHANLGRMIHAVSQSSSQVASAAVELSASSEQLLQNANAQKSQSEQIVAAMHEMGAAISEVSSNAARAAEGASNASIEAKNGGDVVGQTAYAMQNLTTTSRATTGQIEGLAKSSDDIGKILSVIGEIAEQTNLLALNAAIEAARAGEQGRGFAVVAGEVRRLAERTATATREIGSMITGIQDAAKLAVESIRSEIVHVNESAESAARAGETIHGIIEASEDVRQMVGQIATASNQQTAAIQEVNRNLDEIARLIDHSTSGTKDSATACSELSHLASEMQELVAQFRFEHAGTKPRTIAAKFPQHGAARA